MKTISYLVEITTEIPVTILEQPKENMTFYEVVIQKTQEVMDNLDLNAQEYQVRVVSELKEGE